MNGMLSLISQLKHITLLQLFTVYLRYLIGLAFIIAAIGMGKLSSGVYLMNAGAKPLHELQPIQQFFRVMADSGLYWQFIGWTQIVAGILLATQRFAKIGALIFFGLILNIFIITVSYNFTGTPVVTGLMLLATTYLLVWDADSLQFIFRKPSQCNLPNEINYPIADHIYWSVLGVVLIVLVIVQMMLRTNPLFTMLSALITGLAALAIFFLFRKKFLT